MKHIDLLDCTLRDGGYVNDWNFGHHVITGAYRRLENAGVDYIEVGFLDSRREFDINRSIVPDTDCFNTLFAGIKKGNSIPVAMIDYGTCPIENIGNADSTFIDGIRVIFKKERIKEALPFCKQIKEKGYKLFIQAISITAYSDKEMLEYIEQINEIKPFAFSIVDTYGLLNKKRLTDYFTLIDNNLSPEIKIGYHGHNNFQLAFSNTMSFLSTNTKRSLIADATVYGMGKSAGNCPIELLALHLNSQYEKKYDISQILEILDTDLLAVYEKNYWGYKYNFYISAMQNCHPDYVKYLLDKKTLTVSAVNEILTDIPVEKKLLFDKDYIRNAYLDYQTNNIDDRSDLEELKDEIGEKNVLLIGPGKTIATHSEIVKKYIEKNNPYIISVNFIPDEMNSDCLFISNSKRYGNLCDLQSKREFNGKIAITSNITPVEDFEPDFTMNYASLLKMGEENMDSAILLCLGMLVKMNLYEVALAGFDGFVQDRENYVSEKYALGSQLHEKDVNELILNGIRFFRTKMNLDFLTPSLYAESK